MTGFRLTPLAEADVGELVDSIAPGSSHDQGHAVLANRFPVTEQVAETPGMGHARADLTDEDVRFWSVHSFLIIYRPEPGPLEVVRVLHGARGPEAWRHALEP